MSLLVRVEGGTGAGKRRVRPKPESWTCRCFQGTATARGDDGMMSQHITMRRGQPGYVTRCTDCGERRPS